MGGPSPLSVPSPPPAEADWEPTAGGLDLARGTHTQSGHVYISSTRPSLQHDRIEIQMKKDKLISYQFKSWYKLVGTAW